MWHLVLTRLTSALCRSTEIQAAAGQSCLPIFDTEVQQEQQEEAGIVQQLAQAAGKQHIGKQCKVLASCAGAKLSVSA